jgi:hypothetical protein
VGLGGAQLERSNRDILGSNWSLAEGEKSFLGDSCGGVDYVGRCVVDPLDVRRVVSGKVITCEGNDVGGVEVVQAADVYSI